MTEAEFYTKLSQQHEKYLNKYPATKVVEDKFPGRVGEIIEKLTDEQADDLMEIFARIQTYGIEVGLRALFDVLEEHLPEDIQEFNPTRTQEGLSILYL